jgi:hypothetical protein
LDADRRRACAGEAVTARVTPPAVAE